MKEVATEEFKAYSRQVRANAKALADELVTVYGYTLATGGTENHLILWDLKPQGVTGSKMQTVCDHCAITLNKNAVLGDRSALTPGGVRIGTPALTTRGLNEADFRKVAGFLHRALQLAIEIQTTNSTLKAFEAAVVSSDAVKALKKEIQDFITQFPMPGFDATKLKYTTADI